MTEQSISPHLYSTPWALYDIFAVQLRIGVATALRATTAIVRRTGLSWNKKHLASARALEVMDHHSAFRAVGRIRIYFVTIRAVSRNYAHGFTEVLTSAPTRAPLLRAAGLGPLLVGNVRSWQRKPWREGGHENIYQADDKVCPSAVLAQVYNRSFAVIESVPICWFDVTIFFVNCRRICSEKKGWIELQYREPESVDAEHGECWHDTADYVVKAAGKRSSSCWTAPIKGPHAVCEEAERQYIEEKYCGEDAALDLRHLAEQRPLKRLPTRLGVRNCAPEDRVKQHENALQCLNLNHALLSPPFARPTCRLTLSISGGAHRRPLHAVDAMVDLEKFSQDTIDVGFHCQHLLACSRNMRGH